MPVGGKAVVAREGGKGGNGKLDCCGWTSAFSFLCQAKGLCVSTEKWMDTATTLEALHGQTLSLRARALLTIFGSSSNSSVDVCTVGFMVLEECIRRFRGGFVPTTDCDSGQHQSSVTSSCCRTTRP